MVTGAAQKGNAFGAKRYQVSSAVLLPLYSGSTSLLTACACLRDIHALVYTTPRLAIMISWIGSVLAPYRPPRELHTPACAAIRSLAQCHVICGPLSGIVCLATT
jgi:hypothetical protein